MNEVEMEAEDGVPVEPSSSSSSLSQDYDSFTWDEGSQLYYHARSGFYHDPVAGWYYSGNDGLYYKFEDGSYVPLDTMKCDQFENCGYGEFGLDDYAARPKDVVFCDSDDYEYRFSLEEEREQTNQKASTSYDPTTGMLIPTSGSDDTLIDLYLSLDQNLETVAHEEMRFAKEERGIVNNHEHEEEEGDSSDVEKWRAQYGQVTHSEEETTQEFPAVDLWDWGVIKEHEKEGKFLVARLVGRLVQPSAKLHPSMAAGAARLRTSPISEVHLDLVQVKSGKVYKLRSPSAEYLTTLSFYDSSNPTKDWGFPELSVENISILSQSNSGALIVPHPPATDEKSSVYRDRAAERRVLHGGFGIGPGQKKTVLEGSPSASPPRSSEEAAAEALEMSMGAGSYAQKILKKMGWKEGEALGAAKQGLKQPLTVEGNKGNAGLGWCHYRRADEI